MEDNRKVKVVNRSNSTVAYVIPEMQNLKRVFYGRQEKILTYEELRCLSSIPGGMVIITDYLIIKDPEVVKELGLQVEPEYWYEKDQVINLMKNGSLEDFLDCLDFAPDGVLDLIKELSVSLPLTDTAKRKAIWDKLGFNVDVAVAMKEEAGQEKEDAAAGHGRRVPVPGSEQSQVKSPSTARRVAIVEK